MPISDDICDVISTFLDTTLKSEYCVEYTLMEIKVIGYWVATAIIALETLAGGFVDLTHGREALVAGSPVVDVVRNLGYPVYVLMILGFWKIPGSIILVVPGFLRAQGMGLCRDRI